jgi:hypothetical protein
MLLLLFLPTSDQFMFISMNQTNTKILPTLIFFYFYTIRKLKAKLLFFLVSTAPQNNLRRYPHDSENYFQRVKEFWLC